MVFDIFATPHEGDFVGLFNKLSLRSLGKTEELLDNHLRRTRDHHDFGAKNLRGDPKLEARANGLWTPEMGFIRMGINKGFGVEDEGWFDVLVNLTLFLSGMVNEINVSYSSDKPIVIGGQYLEKGSYKLVGLDAELSVFDKVDNKLFSLNRIDGATESYCWVLEHDSSSVFVGPDVQYIKYSNSEWYKFWEGEDKQKSVLLDRRLFGEKLSAALSCINEFSPRYYDWISLVLKEIAPLKGIKGGTESASFIFCPGQIHLTEPTSVPSTVSALIHECSHQYFHMLMWNTVLCDSHAPFAYSALKDMERPLSSLLLAHHAVGNILLGLGEINNKKSFIIHGLEEEISHTKKQLLSLNSSINSYNPKYLQGVGYSIFLAINNRLRSFGFL